MPIYSPGSGSANGSTVGELIDRVYRDFLHAGDDQPVILTLTGGATEESTSWTCNTSSLSADEEALLGPGVILELGLEQVRIVDGDPETGIVTVIRGVNGTTPVVHAGGSEIRVAPAFSRQSVFDAVADNVVNLYPDLSVRDIATVITERGPVEVSADLVSITEAKRYTTSGRAEPVAVELLRDYPPSSTGQAVSFHGTPNDATVYLSYEARFSRPVAESDDLATFGVDQAWNRIILVGAVAQLLAGRDIDAVAANFITEQLATEVTSSGDVGQIRNRLLQYHALLLHQARRNMRADRIIPVVMMH